VRRPRGLQGISVLVVDPDRRVREWFEDEFGGGTASEVALIESADGANEAQSLCDRYRFDVMVVERDLPEGPGIAWAQRFRDAERAPEIIITSARADLDTAMECLHSGVADFFPKPLQAAVLLNALRRCSERIARNPRGAVVAGTGRCLLRGELMGQSRQMAEVCTIIERAAPMPVTVLIEGESGTGKELAARLVHKLSGCRGKFVPVNCGSISSELLESELFGHAKGAFTGAHQQREGLFAAANHGTLFLDEIGEMPLSMQAKLLRVLDEHEIRPVGSDRQLAVDVRVIAATNRSLLDQVHNGKFREDLFFRLNVLVLTMPPLRERREDIAELIHHYAQRLAREFDRPALHFSSREMRALERYDWPGNVRELINLIERCLLLGKPPQDCLEGQSLAPVARDSAGAGEGYPLDWSLRDIGRAHTLRVLAATGGNKSRAARRLGISRKTLDRNLKAWHEPGQPGAADGRQLG
jgi:DNA-binding NtrC family response regulator